MLNFTLGLWANPENNVWKGQLYVWCLIYYFAAHTWWRSFMRWCNRAGSLSRVIGLRHRSWRLEWMNWWNWNWKKWATTTNQHTHTIKLFKSSWKEYLHIVVISYWNIRTTWVWKLIQILRINPSLHLIRIPSSVYAVTPPTRRRRATDGRGSQVTQPVRFHSGRYS